LIFIKFSIFISPRFVEIDILHILTVFTVSFRRWESHIFTILSLFKLREVTLLLMGLVHQS
jgi:hypothetical protein